MGLDYSQRRLIGAGLKAKGREAKRLRMYAFLTGLMSTLISLTYLYLTIRQR
jgi:hypothetical protein